jgi:RNA polymerase sigma-70 factor (ECF subfamily)
MTTETLLRDVAPRLLRVCRGVLGPGPDAEDATQDSLVALARALPAFRGDSSLETFATRIALRTAWRVHQRRAERMRRTAALDEQRRAVEGDAAGWPAELRMVVWSLLEELPGPQAEALVLRFVLGYSLPEIAETSGAPINTVRSRIRLAREAMQRRLVDDERLRSLLEEEHVA